MAAVEECPLCKGEAISLSQGLRGDRYVCSVDGEFEIEPVAVEALRSETTNAVGKRALIWAKKRSGEDLVLIGAGDVEAAQYEIRDEGE